MPDGVDARVAGILNGLDLGDWDVLIDPTAEELAAIYADGTRRGLKILELGDGETTVNEARAQFGLPPIEGGDVAPAIVNQVHARALDWARVRAAELVTQIRDNTRDMLRATVADAIEGGWPAATLAERIGESAGFSDARATTISRTEIIRANNQGNLAAYKASGVAQGKEWLTAHDPLVEIMCLENEKVGPIDLDDIFPSGDECPPAHPNCRCSIAPTVAPLKKD